ncbi:phage tail tape measure protein [Aeromonas sp. ASNIH8]|uniref:phage tail tape measure protein n=1 Tax=Aeromonas sp. ASNIH8 TaxID=1920113 RepID=UPI000CDDC6E7|nr:phage tail tape measure protein [Aeromonas sp. ASNIH8]POV91518.1 phage tail tape measure protein [Aeromonas sp. ASNIH8]
MSTLKLQILLGAVDKLTAPLKAVTGQSRITAKDLADTKAKVRDLEKQSGQVDGYRTLGKQIGATRAELTQAQQTAQRMAKELAATANPTKAMTRELERAKGAVRDLTNKEREMVSRHGAMKAAMQQAGINTRQLSQHQRQLKSDLTATTAQLEQQRSKLTQVAAQQKRIAQVKANYDKTMAMRGTMAGYGAAGMATGAAGLYKINSIASVGLDFDAQMSKVQALTRLQKDSAELAMLRQQARDLGASTSFTAMDAAGGQGFLAMAGFTPQNIKAAMPGILDMAKAGGMEIARTADIASNILSGFQLPATEMGRVGDSLVATFTRSNTSLEMLGETMKYAAPIAAGLGVDMETVSAMAGKLGDAGVQGSMAGTGISAILTRLVKPTKEVRGALDALGVKAKDATGKLRDPLDLLEDIERKTSKMADGGVAYLAAISGQEALKAMIPLVAASKKGADSVRALRDSVYGATGEAAEVARVMADNARGDIDGLTSAWQDLNIELMTSQNGPLRGLIQQITAMTRGVGEWMRKNPELTATIAKVAAITAVTATVGGGLLLVLAGLLGPIAAIKMGLGMMLTMGGPLLTLLKGLSLGFLKLGVAILTTPIGWIIAGIAAIAVGAYLIYKNWDQLGPWFKSTWEKCKAATGEFWDYLTTLPSRALNAGKALIDGLIGGISAKWEELKAKVKSITDILPDWMKGGSSTKVAVQHSSTAPAVQARKEGGFAGFYDKGGLIPAGKWGVAGENGPEVVKGPANIISRRQTAAMASAALLASMPLAAMQPHQDATRTIREQVMPAELRQPVEAARTIREQVMPAELRQPADTVRTIREQVMPAELRQPADTVRTIREQVMSAELRQPADTARTIREQVMPAELRQPADTVRTIREQVMPAELRQPVEAAQTIREQVVPAELNRPANSYSRPGPRIVETPKLAPARGDTNIHISAPIHIAQQPGQSSVDVAQEVRRELDRRERQASARTRASLRDNS